MAHIVILGGGMAGTIMANRLRRQFAADVRAGETRITVIDQDSRHVYQPGLLFVPFGWYEADQVVRPRVHQLHRAVECRQAAIERVDAAANIVELATGERIGYDVLIIATGVRLVPEETEGLTGVGWREWIFDFYTVEGATALHDALERFEGGRIVMNVVAMPIKCPVAPLEFSFLADWYFTQRGIRDKVELVYVTPLDGAFTRPIASSALSRLLHEKKIDLVTEFDTSLVDGERGTLTSHDGREVAFDLLVTIPLHQGAAYVARSPGLGDETCFVRTDPQTLQAKVAPNIFAIGDATNLPTPKTGLVAHFESEIVTENVRRFLAGESLEADFDGHASCFIETEHDKALMLDFSDDEDPLRGNYPFAKLGPMHLPEQTHLNHLGELGFRWVYWNVLLPGHALPGLESHMTLRGKRRSLDPTTAVMAGHT